jgi:hypothetical protein
MEGAKDGAPRGAMRRMNWIMLCAPKGLEEAETLKNRAVVGRAGKALQRLGSLMDPEFRCIRNYAGSRVSVDPELRWIALFD